MKIECILRREGGTRAEIGGTEYHFEPLADGAHVAEIANDEHADRFLAIPEAYKVYRGKDKPTGEPRAVTAPAPTEPKPEPEASTLPLSGSEEHPPQFEIGGNVYTQREIVEKAFAASGLTSDQWNELGDDERAAKIDIVLDGLADAAEAAAKPKATKAASKKAAK